MHNIRSIYERARAQLGKKETPISTAPLRKILNKLQGDLDMHKRIQDRIDEIKRQCGVA